MNELNSFVQIVTLAEQRLLHRVADSSRIQEEVNSLRDQVHVAKMTRVANAEKMALANAEKMHAEQELGIVSRRAQALELKVRNQEKELRKTAEGEEEKLRLKEELRVLRAQTRELILVKNGMIERLQKELQQQKATTQRLKKSLMSFVGDLQSHA